MSNLFAAPTQGSNGLGGGAGRSVVKFKCGRMKHEALPDGSFRVTARPERGFLELRRDQPEIYRFVWSTREGYAPTDRDNNIILMPREQAFEKVATGNEEERVFLLRFHSGGRKVFYWVQESDASGDEQLLKSIRTALGCDESEALNEALMAIGILPSEGEGNDDNDDNNATDGDAAENDDQAPGPEDTKEAE